MTYFVPHCVRILLSALLVFATFAYAKTPPDMAAAIDAAVAPHFKPTDPGGTIIATKDGKIVFRKAYGMANLDKKIALEPAMTFRLGSVTKQFTAVAIMMLADQGKLQVGDDIRKYLPDFPAQKKTITIEHLLTHTSGVMSYTSMLAFRTVMNEEKSLAQMIDFFKNEPLQFEPGSRMEYSNSGYFLLGAIIEKASGESYANFLAKNIFEPLGMKYTAYEGFERGVPKRVEGYSVTKAGFELSQPISMGWPYAAGSLVSNVDDLAIWDAAITAGKLLKPTTWKQVFTPYKLSDGKSNSYCYGWFLENINGTPSIEHGGGIPGFSTHITRIASENVYVAVLMNQDQPEVRPNYLAGKVGAMIIDKPYPEFNAIKVDTKVMDQVGGIYKVDGKEAGKNTLTITREGDKIFSQREGGRKNVLLPASGTEYFIANTFVHFKFLKNDKGVVTSANIFRNGELETAQRTSDKPPTERQAIALSATKFDAYVGEYQLAPGFVLTVSREGEKFMSQATGQSKLEIFPESEETFFLKVVDAKLQFVKDAEGKITQLILFQGGREMLAKKIK